MDQYPEFPPPEYSTHDTLPTPQQRDVPNCLRIQRKPVSIPVVQARAVHNQLETPRPLGHGRSVGDLRKDEYQSNTIRKPVYTPPYTSSSQAYSVSPQSPEWMTNDGYSRSSSNGVGNAGGFRRNEPQSSINHEPAYTPSYVRPHVPIDDSRLSPVNQLFSTPRPSLHNARSVGDFRRDNYQSQSNSEYTPPYTSSQNQSYSQAQSAVRPVEDGFDRPSSNGIGNVTGYWNEPHSSMDRKPVYTSQLPALVSQSHMPVNHSFEPRRIHAARSMGDLRRAYVDESPIPPLPPPPPQLSVRTPQYQPTVPDSQLYLSPVDADFRRSRTAHSSTFDSSTRASSSHSNMSFTSTTERPLTAKSSNSSVSSAFRDARRLVGTLAPSPTGSTAERPPLTSQSSTSSVSSAFREARHFVGGIVPHPTESTKHFTILRHSHGLVFYQGTSTTLAITIFSDTPLPQDRTIWLQNRGWSGNAGMKIKALTGATGQWLNVTPSTVIRADQVKPSDERAWQRDILSFQKKANRKQQGHMLRETAIVRIPAEAGDGYFQFVMCQGDKKKVLCTSPVFRVVSTSASPYSLKGASLKTLPLELGALAISTYARNTAGRVIGPAAMVGSVVKGRVEKYMPSFWVQKAAAEASGAWNKRHEQDGQSGVAGEEIDLEQGPRSPYPIIFCCRTKPAASSLDVDENFSTPTVNLGSVPDEVKQRLHGFYYGWCRVHRKSEKGLTVEGQEWYQVVFSALLADISQLARVDIAQASKKYFTIRLIRESEDELFFEGSKLEIQVMGYIRPDEPMQRATLEQGLLSGDEAAAEAAFHANVNDMTMTLSILNHHLWGADEGHSGAAAKLGRVVTGFSNARTIAQRQLAKVPLHMAGVRSPVDGMNSAMLSNGFYVVR